MVKFGLVVAAMAMMVGCAQEVEELDEERGDTDSALAGNARATAGEAEVVGIQIRNAATPTKVGLCTGTVIAPRVVLTAAHCTLGGVKGAVFVGPTAGTATEISNVTKFVSHPGYDPDTKANDIGIVIMAKPLTTVRTLAVNRQPLEQLVNPNAKDPVVKLVGYGATARAQDGSTTGSGTKRVGFSLLTDMNPKEIFVSAPPGAGANGCGGDSGGPTFLETNRGWLLIATESRGDRLCKTGTIKVRTDAVIGWIDATIAANR